MMRWVRSPAAARKSSGMADRLPAAGVVLAHPELVVAELVELGRELEVAAQLQGRVLADRVVRREERAELHALCIGRLYHAAR